MNNENLANVSKETEEIKYSTYAISETAYENAPNTYTELLKRRIKMSKQFFKIQITKEVLVELMVSLLSHDEISETKISKEGEDMYVSFYYIPKLLTREKSFIDPYDKQG